MIHDAWGLVFPGQGSQAVGMLNDIAKHYPIVKEVFQLASDLLHYDLWDLVLSGPKDKLDETTYTQPALLTASYALYRIIQPRLAGLTVKAMAGHSLGEYSALVCAGALDFQAAVKLVAARGQAMQQAVPNGVGAMAAIVGLSDSAVQALCDAELRNEHDVLAPANWNSEGQVVIAGHRALVERAIQQAKLAGARLAILLPVSVPSHCSLMRKAAVRFETEIKHVTFREPIIPVINNVYAVPYQDASTISKGLLEQLYSPVRWVETIQALGRLSIKHVIECGPGKVLTGLIKRTDPSMTVYPIGDYMGLNTFLNV